MGGSLDDSITHLKTAFNSSDIRITSTVPYWNYGTVKVLHAEMRRLRYVWIEAGRPRGKPFDSYRVTTKARKGTSGMN